MNWKKITPWNWFKKPARVAQVRTGGTVLPLRPGVDIEEGSQAYTLRVELPGIDAKDVSVEVEGHTLSLRAEKRQEHEADERGYHRTERSYRAFQRLVPLPDDADGEGAKANLKNGVLKLQIPKRQSAPARGRSISIQAG